MGRAPRRSAANTATTQPLPESPGSAPGDLERLRAVLRERRAGRPQPRPSFRERLEAWLEEEL